MSLKSSKKVDTNRYELVVTVDEETFGKALETAYRQNVKKMAVPGFRKGKAPRHIIEKLYGENVFFEDALNLVYADSLEAAIKEAELKFVDDKIDFDLVSIEKTGCEFKATITVEPEVEIKDYKGIKVEKVKAEVTDSEVDDEVSKVAERNSRLVTVEDRAAKDGDITVIDFEGFVDGKAFEGGKGESFSLTLGSGQFIPGFEEQVVGHNTEDEFEVNVKFPEDYQAEDLKGKDATFKCKLHEIKVRELPEIDDEFVKDVSEFDTLADYKADLKAKALEKKEKDADNDVENQIIDVICENLNAEIPEAMYEKRLNQQVEDFAYRLQAQGLGVENYLQFTGQTPEDFRNVFKPMAERQVKLRLALQKIVKLEKIEPTEEDIENEFKKLAEQYSMDIEKVKGAIAVEDLKTDIAVGKAMDLVKESAVVTEVEKKTEAKKTTTTKKPAAKKPAAKKTTAKKAEEKKAEDK